VAEPLFGLLGGYAIAVILDPHLLDTAEVCLSDLGGRL
jgi:hypothetical protein